MRRRIMLLLPIFIALVAAGCHAQAEDQREASAPDEVITSQFDAKQTGELSGMITWEGPIPESPTIRFMPLPPSKTPSLHTLAHIPKISPQQGVRDAVISLRGVAPKRAKPWPFGEVVVEHQGREIDVVQDGQRSKIGFVRRGSSISAMSLDRDYQSLRGRGADFFALPLPDSNQPAKRRMQKSGHVELSSAVGFYWMRAHLFVADHPYFVRSDPEGRFSLAEIPPGEYDVVCWLPSWVERGRERDPESGLIQRVYLAPACTQVRKIEIRTGTASQVNFVWSKDRIEMEAGELTND